MLKTQDITAVLLKKPQLSASTIPVKYPQIIDQAYPNRKARRYSFPMIHGQNQRMVQLELGG